MKQIVSIAACVLFTLAFVFSGSAQDGPKVIKGGVLNGKAISLPKPVYPAEAKTARLGGSVALEILIDENGAVVEANPRDEGSTVRETDIDGMVTTKNDTLPDPLLVEAARDAAMNAKFSPTVLSGEPVKVSGVIVYSFVFDTLKSLSGGVLNGKAIDLPAPTYPAAAKAVRAAGTVTVQILIDENGDVVSAAAVSGHPLLRSAAAAAAREAKFSPTLLSGNPVKVSGILTYAFVLPDKGEN
ncbi:MAG: TonB family protein [Pyrinomonadaceae bacterium]